MEMLSRASRGVFERPEDAPWRDVLTSTTSWIDGDDVEGDDVDACVDVVSEEADETCAYGRSLSTEGERAAAAAAALEPTIPVESLGDEAREDDGAVRWTVSQSLRSSMDGAEDAATMEAKGTASASASAKKRARVAETPAATRGDADGDARPSASPMTMTMTTSRGDGDESAGAGRVLRFSGEESARDAPPPETRSADDATRATSRRGEYARAMTAKFTDGTPTRVMFSDASEDSSTSARAGVVVESPDESRVYVFDVDASGSTCAGSCVIRASDRRVTRRRSSLAASPRASASADAVGMTPRGDFVVAADAEDGVRVLRVRSFEQRNRSSDATTPDDEYAVKHLRCGFRATRVATTMDGDAFRLAVAGEPGRCATWTWTVAGDDDAFVLDDDASFEELPPATFRGVAPKPGSPTTLRWLCGAADGESRLVVVVDRSLLCAWEPRGSAREKSAYAVKHTVQEFVPVDPLDAGCDGKGKTPMAALVLAERKRGAFAGLESTEFSEDGSPSSEAARRGTAVVCALLRAHDVTIGDAVFASAAENAVSLACGRRGGVACFGDRDGRVVAWNYLTGERASVVSVVLREDEEENDDDDDEFDVSVRSVAVARTSFAACARDRVSIFSRALDA